MGSRTKGLKVKVSGVRVYGLGFRAGTPPTSLPKVDWATPEKLELLLVKGGGVHNTNPE